MMSLEQMVLGASVVVVSTLIGSHLANAADAVSDQDKTFVAKVSQGGMYEVELGKVAETKGSTQDIRDAARPDGGLKAHPT